jgi:hypothetical protein
MGRVQVASQLTYYALDRGTTGYDTKYGWGVVQADLAVGLYQPDATASIVNSHPKLTWSSIPMASVYRIWARHVPYESTWSLCETTGLTDWTDLDIQVSSFYGYNTIPPMSGEAVSYYVEAVAANGKGTGLNVFSTFIPTTAPPCKGLE